MLTYITVQTDSLVFKTIAESTSKTAVNTSLGPYDWVTLSVAALALLIALITLSYTIRTYASQRQTERNTRKVTFEVQRTLICSLVTELLDRYAKAAAIYFNLYKYHFTCWPNKNYANRLCLPLFFVREESDVLGNEVLYIRLMILKEDIANYNALIENNYATLTEQSQMVKARQDAMDSILTAILNLLETTSSLIKEFYPNVNFEDDLASSVFSGVGVSPQKVPSYPVEKWLVDEEIFLKHFTNFFVDTLMALSKVREEMAQADLKVKIRTQLINQVSSILTDIHNSFYDFDLDGTLPFIENDKGVALRTPSTLKPHKFNYSRVELYAVDDELRLSSTEEYHFREFPTLSIIYGDKVEKYVFVEAYDKSGKMPQYRYLKLTDDLVNQILSADSIQVNYRQFPLPSSLADEQDVEEIYKVTLSANMFYRAIYSKR